MEGYLPLKLKRKDLEDVNDDFSDFSLSSPARKIRRLVRFSLFFLKDAELPPIIEEEDVIPFEHSLPQEQGFGSNSPRGLKIEELPPEPSNEERAIVLFKPMNTSPLLQTPSNFTVSVNPHLISGFKNQLLWSSQSNSWRLADDEAVENNKSGSSNGCLAVVPWVPSQFSSAPGAGLPPEIDSPEMMDAQEVEESKMDIEDGNVDQRTANDAGGISVKASGDGSSEWVSCTSSWFVAHASAVRSCAVFIDILCLIEAKDSDTTVAEST
ncbi:UNVERIFIED_CONTAM: hypothetical protein Scaly_1989900 [Sesamum calycinum]|uniref:Uncharacterized protein n=1 Tax=Sesamum calycinum TaxID=2727403 RepID=A0AAW2N2E1_9LAMI